tara:strand:- start:205 stop:1191 length:987 start_codon:yes stop_codon:yes gene_type:complete
MVSAVNVGSLNMPKMLRHMRHRSSQVRDLTFVRDEIKQKDVKTTDAANVALTGPAVSFGYEKSSSADATAGVDTAYHRASPEIVLPGLTMLQSPIVSRRGRLEKIGHRISGACVFYAPSADYIQNLDNFGETKAFAELESYDKLYDVEKILTKVDSFTGASATSHTLKTFADATAGYQVDRLRFAIKSSGTLTGITLNGNESGVTRSLKWGGSLALSSTDYITIDVPLRDVEVGDTTSIYKNGTRTVLTASTDNTIIDLDKLHGASTHELSSLLISLQSSASVELKDIYVYKEAEWRIESIKDYRDEYMQIAAVRVRGDRASRRRAYG